MTAQPVSVIVPCFNEAGTIRLLLDAIAAQTYPIDDLEVLISDGRSTDATRETIRLWCASHPQLKVKIVDNPARVIPSALNRAIEAASGEFVVRLDAHCVPNPDYIERCVADLKDGKGENVGGRWDIQPGGKSWQARSIVAAVSSPIGVGDAKYRYSEDPGFVDTVPFGAYRRKTLEDLGGYDETLLTNEDYDLNVRIRQNGGKIYFDPAIRSVYFARPSFASLAKQYDRYGYWKVAMLEKSPKSIRLRQLAPPLFVLTLICLTVLSILQPFARSMLLLTGIFYIGALLYVSIRTAGKKDDLGLIVGMPIAVFIMHFFWGFGFLRHIIKKLIRRFQQLRRPKQPDEIK